jgi:predicted kinase
MIDESGNAGSWKLINIIICDGKKDKNSKKSWNEVIQAYQQAKSRIRAYEFRTIIIAYNVTQQEYSELLRFNQLDP